MIHTNRVVTVGDQESVIDKPIILYRGDREVEVEFELIGNEFMFSTNGNVIKSVNASHGQLVLNTPSGDNMFSELAECHDGKVVFVITKEMIDEFIEIGFYSFQIRLYDGEQMRSRVTIPPVFSGLDIRNPIAAEDETNVVGMAVVDYARIYRDQSNEELSTFDWQGNYIKTDWVHHDIITENKMNKIEDGLWAINNRISESDNVFLKKAEQMEVQRQNDVNTLNNKDTQLTNDIQNVNRTLTNAVNTLRVDMEVGDINLKNELAEYVEGELAEVNSHLGYIASFVTPEMFGAKCDGVTDDSEALRRMHTYANQNGFDVRYPSGRSIYLKEVERISVQTNVDFNGCEVIIDDTDTQNANDVFIIENSITHTSLNASTCAAIGVIKENERKTIPQFAGRGDALVRLVNSNKKIYIRYGNNANSGDNLTDYIIVNNNGDILVPCAYDFDTITSCTIKPISSKTLTIENGNFKTIANRDVNSFSYIKRGIGIERSNVILRNINHTVDQDKNNIGKPYNGFLNFEFCARVKVENCTLQPKFVKYDSNNNNTPKGTYDLGTNGLVDCTFENLHGFSTSADHWGVWGGNYMKNIVVRNSDLNRIDAHRGCFGIVIEHCKIGSRGFTLCGGWDLVINDVELIGCRRLVELREDYGSSWKGSIKISNVSHYWDGDSPTIIAGTNVLDHDFGYDRYVGLNSVTVDNYRFKGAGCSRSPRFIYLTQKGTTKSSKHYLCENYSIRNVTFESSANLYLIDAIEYNFDCLNEFIFESLLVDGDTYHDMKIKPNVFINVSDINSQQGNVRYEHKGSDYLGYVATDNYTDVTTRPIYKFDMSNCTNVYMSFYGMPSICHIRDSVIKRYYAKNVGTRNQAFVDNCEFKPEGSSVMQMARFNGLGTFINNCKFHAPIFGGVKYTDTYTEIQRAYEFLQNANRTSFKQMLNITNCSFSEDINLNAVFPYYDQYAEKVPNGVGYKMKYIYNGTSSDFNAIKDAYPRYTPFFNRTLNLSIIKNASGVWTDMAGNPIDVTIQ